MKRYDYDCIHGKLVEHSQGTFYLAADVEAMKAGAVERIAQYMEAYEGYQGDYSLTVGKRIFALIFEEGK